MASGTKGDMFDSLHLSSSFPLKNKNSGPVCAKSSEWRCGWLCVDGDEIRTPPPPRDPHPTRWEKSETSDVWLMLSSYAESIYRHYGGTGYAFLPVVDRGPPRINTRDSAHWFTDRFVSAVPNFFLSEAPSTMRHCEMSSSAPSNTPDRTNAAQVQVCAILEHSAPPPECTAQLGQWMEGRENSGSCGHLLY